MGLFRRENDDDKNKKILPFKRDYLDETKGKVGDLFQKATNQIDHIESRNLQTLVLDKSMNAAKKYLDQTYHKNEPENHMNDLSKLANEEGNKAKVYRYLKENYPSDCLTWVKEVDWTLKKDVPLEEIKMARRPGGARETDKVKGIAGAIKEGKKMEPVVLVRIPDGTIKIADGYHRTLGFKHAEKKTINAWIADVPDKEGPWDKEMHERKLNIGKKGFDEMLGLAKAADSNVMEDFMAGVDPTGVRTFENAMNNERNQGLHQAIGDVGGFVGGSLVGAVAPAGLMGVGSKLLRKSNPLLANDFSTMARGSLDALNPKKLLQYGKSLGPLSDYRDLANNIQTKTNNLVSNPPLSTGDLGKYKDLGKGIQTNLKEMVKGKGSVGDKVNTAKNIKAQVGVLSDFGKQDVKNAKKIMNDTNDIKQQVGELNELGNNISQQYYRGLPIGEGANRAFTALSTAGAAGLSGLVGGASAHMQYNQGKRTKEMMNEKDDLTKVANLRKDVKKAINERSLSPEEYEAFTSNLKSQYGVDTDYLYADHSKLPGLSYAIPNPEDVEKVRNSRSRKRFLGLKDYEGKASTLVNSVPLEDIILHETGHILDPEVVADTKKADRLQRISALSGLGALGVGFLPEKVPEKAKWGVGAGLAGLAGITGFKSTKLVNKGEDTANEFVKKHWANELGSVTAADDKFNKSLLPKARKTYRSPIKKGLGAALGAGASLAYGLLSKKM